MAALSVDPRPSVRLTQQLEIEQIPDISFAFQYAVPLQRIVKNHMSFQLHIFFCRATHFVSLSAIAGLSCSK